MLELLFIVGAIKVMKEWRKFDKEWINREKERERILKEWQCGWSTIIDTTIDEES